MGYRIMGRAHAAVAGLVASQRGQGTVEYVALVLLVAFVLAGVVAAAKGSGKFGKTGIADAIVQHMKDAMGHVK